MGAAGGGESVFEIGAGDVLVIPQSVGHVYGADDAIPWSIMWAPFFAARQLNEFVRLLNVTEADPILRLPPGELDRLHFEELYLTLEGGCTLANLVASSARLRMIVVELGRLRVPTNQRTGSTREAVRQNIEWMRLRRHRKIGLADLAAQAGLSIAHYSACFKRQNRAFADESFPAAENSGTPRNCSP